MDWSSTSDAASGPHKPDGRIAVSHQPVAPGMVPTDFSATGCMQSRKWPGHAPEQPRKVIEEEG
jgi:hypothetical protein